MQIDEAYLVNKVNAGADSNYCRSTQFTRVPGLWKFVTMNYPGICITLVAANLCLTVIIHKRRETESQLVKVVSFEEIRATVTKDVLSENLGDLFKRENKNKELSQDIEELREKLTAIQTGANNQEVDVERCKGEAKSSADSIANQEGEKSSLSRSFDAERAVWSKEIISLKDAIGQPSKICPYIMKTSDEGRKLCGIPAEAPTEQKVTQLGDMKKPALDAPKQR